MKSGEIQSSPPRNIGRSATRNVGWNYLSFGVSKALNFVTVSILAHILSPENFGVVALATLAIDYLSVFNDFGLGAALIHRRQDLSEASNIAFTLNLIIGFVLTLITIAIAPFVALYFNEPSLTSILRWLSLTFTISAIGSVPKARLQRDLKFRQKLIPDLGNVFSKGIVAIALAFTGAGAWALVFGQLVGSSIYTVLLWIITSWRPRLSTNFQIARQLFNYGISVMAESALQIFGDSFDYFLIGRFFDSAALGIYTLAYRLPELLVINTLWVLAAVIFPTFSSVQDQLDVLRKSYLSTIRYLQLIVTPLCLGMFVAAEPIIRVAFGVQWLDSIPIMRVLSLYALVLSIGFHVGDVYKAIGRPDILIKLSIPIFIVRIIALWIGAQYSLLGVAYGHLVGGVVELILRLIVTIRVIKVSLREIMRQLTAFIAGVGLLVLAVPILYVTVDFHPIIRLLSIAVAGAMGYLGTIWLIERETVLSALTIIGLPVSPLKSKP